VTAISTAARRGSCGSQQPPVSAYPPQEKRTDNVLTIVCAKDEIATAVPFWVTSLEKCQLER